MRNTFKNEIGITLVVLIITIIILLILAGITISILTESGLFENAKIAEQESKNKQEEQQLILNDYENIIEEYVDGTRQDSIKTLQLDYDNKVDIKNYKSNENNYIVPSSGIIMASGYATKNSGLAFSINGIYMRISGNTSNDIWDGGSISQLVTKGDTIYFSVGNGAVLEIAYFIPFK